MLVFAIISTIVGSLWRDIDGARFTVEIEDVSLPLTSFVELGSKDNTEREETECLEGAC